MAAVAPATYPAPRTTQRAGRGEAAIEQIAVVAEQVVDEEDTEPEGRFRIPAPHARTPAFGTVQFEH
jgi:hypothetical protein